MSMDCKDLAEFLMTYLDGELTAAERAEFEAHLEICPSCIDYIESYERTIRLEKECEAAPKCEMPDELVRAILAARKKGESSS
jgi:predicted anti-sigma-YlaC factor YlaD